LFLPEPGTGFTWGWIFWETVKISICKKQQSLNHHPNMVKTPIVEKTGIKAIKQESINGSYSNRLL